MALLGLAWDVQPVPARVYAEARAARATRVKRKVPSIIHLPELPDPGPIGLEPVED
jgi:hypothetical protein